MSVGTVEAWSIPFQPPPNKTYRKIWCVIFGIIFVLAALLGSFYLGFKAGERYELIAISKVMARCGSNQCLEDIKNCNERKLQEESLYQEGTRL